MTTAETLPIPNEFDDDNDYWPHPIYLFFNFFFLI